jgi:hypothetical protein
MDTGPDDHQSYSIIVVRLANGPSLWRSHAPTMIRELSGFFHRLDRLSSFLDVEPRPQEMCTYDDSEMDTDGLNKEGRVH